MTGPFANRLFRIAFTLAGCYNLAFGVWAGFWPLAFFDLFNLPAPRYPGIWACLGMVVGVYGLLYLYAAWKLESAWPIIAVGLLGKVLGPIGMAMSFDADWPRRLGMLCVYNDLIWWLPFGLFLVRGTKFGHQLVRAAPWLCAASQVAALACMAVFLRRGMPIQSDVWFRAAYITENVTKWSIGWSLWMFAAMTLVGFYAWWGSKLLLGPAFQPGKPDLRSSLATAAVLIAAFGTVFDFSGEVLSILVLVERAASSLAFSGFGAHPWDAPAFLSVERKFTLLSAGAANALYVVGGILLTLLTSNLPKWVRVSMWVTWAAGILMTLAALINHTWGMILSTVVLFPAMIVWIVWMGLRWRVP
jgi:hypothetical protein